MTRSGNMFSSDSSLFSPSIIRGLSSDSGAIIRKNAASFSSSIQPENSSFRYDAPGSPIKSTQQIPLDWSKFENHTFFNSAEAKVNASFDTIINRYPFDGDQGEVLGFFDSLTGFEKYVYDLFPKNVGFLNFSGSASPLGGSYITINDSEGASSPSLSRSATGRRVLDQGSNPITYEFFIRVPDSLTYGNQIIVQRLRSSNYGITVSLSSSLSADVSGTLTMLVSSGSTFMSSSMIISKGEFQHVCATYDTSPGVNKIQLFRNATLQSETDSYEIGSFGYADSPLTIGSGSNHSAGNFGSISPGIIFSETLSSSIDDFRIFHSVRSVTQQSFHMFRSAYPDENLKLYLKFNEPTGSQSSGKTVIDSSGNGLHTQIINYNVNLKDQMGIPSPLKYESVYQSPVLFPSHPDVISFNESLLASASDYDSNNPNMITKLIPRHYLDEANVFEGFGQDSDLGQATQPYGQSTDFPGGGRLGSPQIIASLLFIWAKHFDEIKIFLDQFGRQLNIDPVEEGTIADIFLPYFASAYGISLPRIFENPSSDQFFVGNSITDTKSVSTNSLQYVQNKVWRRILSDMVEIIRSKGTLHSIKSLIRDVGINPDTNFRFREFGGSKTGKISDQRIKKTSNMRSIDFSGSFDLSISSFDIQGIPDNKPHIRTPGLILSGPLNTADSAIVVRTEPGYPLPGSTPIFDRILTSGSWTYEATYRMTPDKLLGFSHPVTSSLVRLSTSGTDGGSILDSTFLNLLAYKQDIKNSITGSLSLVFRDTWDQILAPKLVIPLSGVNIFDGDPWHISFGRKRNDAFESVTSSSWFLRAGKQIGGNIVSYYENNVLFDDQNSNSVLTTWSNFINMSGTVIHIGSQSVPSDASLYGLSYNSAPVTDGDRSSFFGGKIMNIRFWSKDLSRDETNEHIRNPVSLGVDDAKKNFNFVTSVSGSWEKLRLDLDFIQETSDSDILGNITVIDMSQNLYDLSGSGFEMSTRVIKPEIITYSSVNPYFDQSIDTNKIRIRSWISDQNISEYGGAQAPLSEIPSGESPIDDTRFSIEINAVQALNEDIIKIFSSLSPFDNYIGDPGLQFSEDYPDLEVLRDIYFNRLKSGLTPTAFFEFFKWFESSVGSIIEMMIPRKTKFLGINFVVEPHMLERPKMRYNTFDMYLGPNNRVISQLLVQQLVANIKRY